MGRVGYELAETLLGVALGLHGLLEMGEHLVERQAEAAQLSVWI